MTTTSESDTSEDNEDEEDDAMLSQVIGSQGKVVDFNVELVKRKVQLQQAGVLDLTYESCFTGS